MSESNEAQELDEQIADVKQSIADIDASLADVGPTDAEDRAAALTNREELSGVLDGLQRRRAALAGDSD
jgi:uncharacterized protein involved in exopolysaccharide biosynthesis